MDRTLPAASPLDLATPLVYQAFNTANETQRYLSKPSELDLYATTLKAGDTIKASLVAQSTGSGLAALLQILDSHGKPLALNNQEGGDPRLTF